jgi:hypothetical protein
MSSKIYVLIVAFTTMGLCHGSPVRDLQHGLGIDDSGWKVTNETDDQISWITKNQEGVTLTINHGTNEIRDPNDQKALQDTFRDEAKQIKGGLVEVKMFDSGGVKCGLVTMKFRVSDFNPKADGFAYQMNAIIPTSHGDYVFQVGAAETGTTGTREAIVTVVDMKQRNIADLKEESAHFRRDPYDAKYDADALYMISDDRKWDASLPNHPLTRVRKIMDSIIKAWKISDQIKSEALFKSEKGTGVINDPTGH